MIVRGRLYPLAFFCFELIVGLRLGTAQWLVLRHQVNGAGGWILGTIVGAALGAIAQHFVSISFPRFDYLVIEDLAFAANAAGYAVLQAVCLKRLAPGWMMRLHERAQKAPADGA